MKPGRNSSEYVGGDVTVNGFAKALNWLGKAIKGIRAHLIDTQSNQLLQRADILLYQIDASDFSLRQLEGAVSHLIGDELHTSQRFAYHSLKTLLHPMDRQEVEHSFNSLEADEEYDLKYRIVNKRGETRWIHDRGVKLIGNPGKGVLQGIWSDITELEITKQSLDFIATKDPLTGLYNQFAFNDVHEVWIDQYRIAQEPFAVFRIHIDNYKNITDSLGIGSSDKFVRKFAAQLQDVLGESSAISRISSDLFCALIKIPQADDDTIAKQMALDLYKRFLTPFSIKQFRLKAQISIGISLCPYNSDESYMLLRQAETAMYKAIDEGGGQFEVFTDEMDQRARFKAMIENDLLEALEENQLYLEYQPQVGINTGEIIGAEALIRWRHPVHGYIMPTDFISIAETTGMIREVGMWVFSQACKARASWGPHSHNLVLAINVSPIQLDEGFVEFAHRTLRQYRLPPHCIEIEITENHLMENLDSRIAALRALSQMGIALAIDDFGTGYSSLSCLRQLPLQKIKIDRSFVKEISEEVAVEGEDNGSAIIQAIIGIARSMNMTVLAEGVEKDVQLKHLKDKGCDSFQGYLFSPPISSLGMIKLFNKHDDQIASQTAAKASSGSLG